MTEMKFTVREAPWPEEEQRLKELRTRVFVREQGVPEAIEWDGQDAGARHVLAESDGKMIGCGRLLPDGRIGRLAVSAEMRSQGVGAAMLRLLLDIAREQAMPDVYLHAQSDAVAFYLREGFEARGEPFDEAGIQHLDMHCELDYRDWSRPLVRLAWPAPFHQLVVAQARQARRELAFLSPNLDPRVFENEELFSAIRVFLRGSAMSRLRILIAEPGPLVQRGHRLLSLARRLPSRIEVRCLREHPDWDGDTAVLRDRNSLLALPVSDARFGFYRPDDRARCESAMSRFEMLWNASGSDPSLRNLSI